MPAFVQDEELWQKAKHAADAAGAEDRYAFANHWYHQHGGEGGLNVILSKADAYLAEKMRKEEALSSQGLGQLLRGRIKRESNVIPGAYSNGNYTFTPLREAMIDLAKREARIVAITEGPGNLRDKNYYSKEAIESFVPLLEGVRCFINHATSTEAKERPEGDLWVQCGYFKSTELATRDGRAAAFATMVFDNGEAGREALAKAEIAVRHAQDCPGSREVLAGYSVNGGGRSRGVVDVSGIKYNNVVAFTSVESVDMVTRPARGGVILQVA